MEKITYICNSCRKEFDGVSNSGEEMMTSGNLAFTYSSMSTMNKTYTLTENNSEFHLCANCTKKLHKALKEIGFKTVFDGCLQRKL